jgi:predicted nuclease with RNAse H fold
MRYCGIDVSARADNQQLCTLHERRSADGLELVATFFEPGPAAALARTIEGFGRSGAVVAVDAPSGPRQDLLAAGAPARAKLGLPDGRYERMRVCDALLFRRGLPLYPVPSRDEPLEGWQRWIGTGYDLYAALAGLVRFQPPAADAYEAPVGDGALQHGALCETYPDAVFCTLLGHRPGAKRTPSGLQERIAALRVKGIVDEDGGLWRRTLDELDACAAAYAAYGLAAGAATWVGDPWEGVIVLPTLQLRDRYEPLPPPARAPLAGGLH